MVATGASNQQIARQLVISVNTVKVHLRNIFEKLNVQSRTEASLRAIQEGWVVIADDTAEATEENAALPKTYLHPNTHLELTRWQLIYLIAAVLLAAGVMILPLIPNTPPTVRPNLPVIYAQPPTPAPISIKSRSWVSQASMPSKRASLGLVAFDGKILAIGGVRANNKATRLVEIYDPTTDSWSEGAAKPTATSSISGVVLDEKVYVPGGCTDEGQALDSLEIYDPRTDSWQQGKSLPEPRCAYGLTAFQDRLYLFGGWDGKTFEDTIFVFDPAEERWEQLDSSMPQAKGYAGAAVLDDFIYVVGGYNGQEEFNQTHVFTPKTGEWLEKPPMLEKRGGLGLISAANHLYAVGGGWDQALASSEKYNPETEKWESLESPFTHPWRNMGLTATNNRIYAVGGWNGNDEEFMDAVMSHQFLFQIFLPIGIGN